ncbi:MAG: hypothetical protein BIFFINMI_02135 [Phycisphaerae bacterium]|nr:hypothetical protein [Phycisphaerae bacterium]
MSESNRPDPRDPGEAPSGRAAKIVLLLASAATLAMLVLAMVRENFLSEWRWHQRTYRQMLQASDDPRQRELGDAVAFELRQVDLPQFGTTDRCVSCHLGIDNPAMAGAKQPYAAHPGDYLANHPVGDYGCTICHRGQGAATNFHEAKAVDAHWDYPVLPPGLTQSSCGICHDAGSPLMAEHAPKLALGRRLFEDLGCQSCHRLHGVGGQLGPALDNEGLKTRHTQPMADVVGEPTLANWLVQHFADPQAVVPGSRMPPPHLTARQTEALTVYMLSLQDRDLPQTYVAGDLVTGWDRRLHQRTTDGATLFANYCMRCHGEGTYGSYDKFFERFMPAVRGPGLRAMADETYLRRQILDGRPGTLMPGWNAQTGGLTDAQVDALVNYLKAGDGGPVQTLRPAPTPLAGGDSARGGQLFAQLCSACHGQAGEGGLGPALSNPSFQRAASDELIAATIVNGRADTAMPAFQRPGTAGLTDAEVRDLLAWLRTLALKGK